jgi:dienelactone hydrolase
MKPDQLLEDSRELRIDLRDVVLEGELNLPPGARGLVLFCHGSGSSRFSPRNRRVAADLNRGELGTLLFDLLTIEEQARDERTGELRFNIGLLAARVVGVIDWLGSQPGLARLPLGLFGASTGAAAALVAAAERPRAIAAVVSRGGRPDLAGDRLPEVRAPTLLIVGGKDHIVLEMNREAAAALTADQQIHIVPGASHLFEEKGTMKEVAARAREWFGRYLSPA